MNVIELERSLRQLRLGGMATTLETRLRQAQAEPMAPIDLVASLVTEIGGQIGWLASGMNFRFRKPVHFGDKVECLLTITEIDDRNRAKAEAIFKNQRDEVVIEASLTGIVPGEPERRVMEAMLAEGDPTNKCR